MSKAPSKSVTVAEQVVEPVQYEEEYVHKVYEHIASHFSATRYKPWPLVAKFLQSIPPGWIGLDSGTGNGKYLPLPHDRPGQMWTIGLDRSLGLLRVARYAGENGVVREVVASDALDVCWRSGSFDYAISIATIHHLATPERRLLAVQSLLRSLNPEHGRALIYVWAIEQDNSSKRAIPAASATGKSGQGQDVFVPWVLSGQSGKRKPDPAVPVVDPMIYKRYYHLFEEGELRALVCSAAVGLGIALESPSHVFDGDHTGTSKKQYIEIVQDGWERSNFYVELRLWSK